MASFNSNINLYLPETPDAAVKPEIAFAVAPLHYALHSLHKGVSIVTGAYNPTPAEFATISPLQTLFAGNHRKFYAVAAVAINAGQLCYINGAGQMALSSAAAAATLPQAFATQNVAIGASGEFILFEGLLPYLGVTAGTKYYAADAAGAIGLGAGTVPLLVGVGIATDMLYLRIPVA